MHRFAPTFDCLEAKIALSGVTSDSEASPPDPLADLYPVMPSGPTPVLPTSVDWTPAPPAPSVIWGTVTAAIDAAIEAYGDVAPYLPGAGSLIVQDDPWTDGGGASGNW